MIAEKEYWIARDMDGSLYIYCAPPQRCSSCYAPSQAIEYMQIDNRLFPEITWDGGARKVKLTLELV